MIAGFDGNVVLTWTSLYLGVLWFVAGAACTLFTRRRGLYLAVSIPLIVGLVPALVMVNPPGAVPTIQLFRYGTDLTPYFDGVLIPLFASVVGGLLGELISPSEED